MEVQLFIVFIFSFSCLMARYDCENIEFVDKTIGMPWPLPKYIQLNDDILTVNQGGFKFNKIGKTCDTLDDALTRYYTLIFNSEMKIDNEFILKFRPRTVGQYLNQLNINLPDDCEQYPYFGMDESYKMIISPSGSELFAKTLWGMLRGLETFSQIIYRDDQANYLVRSCVIEDSPRFSHRGVLLDSSRHYIPMKVIKQNLDAMAYNKMNVFHWHIVDDPSFPYQSTAFPDLSNKGAYNNKSHVYSQADIKDVIEYARVRGIRVIPEFDSPGHTQSWGKGQAGLLTECYTGGKPNGNYGPVDPSKDSTYSFLSDFLKEVTSVFPDKYIHLGGDEVAFNCWQSNPQITDFMKKMNFSTNYSKLEQYYMQKLLDIVGSLNSEYIIWQEVIDNGCTVQPNTVVEVWKTGPMEELARVTALGYHAILSSCWYLNEITYGTDWHPFYQCDPHNFNGTDAMKDLVVGGELCMWGEWVDGTNLIARTWPRGSAVAERLWSPASVTDISSATERMEEHRCRMIRRGLSAEPINGPSYCDYEFTP